MMQRIRKRNVSRYETARRLRSGVQLMLLAVIVFTTSCRRSDAGKQTREPLAPMHVHTARAAVKPMDRVVVVTGSFHSREQSTLSVKVPGRLEKISVDIGSVVKKGDELARSSPGAGACGDWFASSRRR
jgi:multidrug efflux pump subunit AcrA (membrane-fusion protein)